MEKKNINIGLVWANPYTGNLGVTALAFSSLFLFEKIARSRNLKFTYYILNSSNRKRKDSFEIGEYKIEIINLPWQYNGSLRSTAKLLLINWRHIINLRKLDIVFDIGAGDSFSDIYGKKRFRKINAIKIIFKKLKKKLVLLPQTLGPFKSEEVKHQAIKSIRNAHLVLTRDTDSYNYIKSINPNQKIIESLDVAFFLPYCKQQLDTEINIKVGINISGLLWNGGYTKDNQFGLKSSYRDITQEIVLYFLKMPDIKIYLIAHVLTDDFEEIENDYKVCGEIHRLYPETILAPFFKSPVEAKSFIGSLDFFTGARMHSCIAAFSTGVPVFPLAYSRKFNGLFGRTLNYSNYADLVKTDISQVMNDLKFAFENRKELKQKISEKQDFILQKESLLLNLLSDAIA